LIYKNGVMSDSEYEGVYNKNTFIRNNGGTYVYIRQAPTASTVDTENCITSKALDLNFHGYLISRP
jgi:hypothetical protein